MEITRFIVNPFQVNAFVLIHNGECVLIDMAVFNPQELQTVQDYLAAKNISPSALLNTHGHIDHICGNYLLQKKYDIPVFMNFQDNFLVETAVDHAELFGMEINQPPIPDKNLTDNMEFDIGGEKLKLIHVPGHSPGSMAFYYEKDAFVITGDALFAGSIGRTDLPQGNHDTLIDSIKNKLMILPQHTAVFPGHGPDTSIYTESLENPYL